MLPTFIWTLLREFSGSGFFIWILTEGFFFFFTFSIQCVLRHFKNFANFYLDADQGFVGIFRGPDRSCTIWHSREPTVLGTVPNGDVLKGPIRNSSLD